MEIEMVLHLHDDKTHSNYPEVTKNMIGIY